MIRKIAEVLTEGTRSLKNSETAQLDAEILLCEALKIGRADLFLRKEDTVENSEYEKFLTFLERRAAYEPVAYIINKKDFYEDTFYVDSRVLVPRPETEILVEEAVNTVQNHKELRVLDICCGSGCIGLSIKRKTGCKLTLSDVSKDALEVAQINALKLFPEDCNIKIIESDLFENIEGKYDLITANPPYLSEKDMEKFCINELEFEPKEALFSGKTGFEFTEKIVNNASEHLNKNGLLILELGYEGSGFLRDSGNLELEKIVKDLNGIDRVAVFSQCTR